MNVVDVLNHYLHAVLPGKLWDGTNPYCNRPGTTSDYAADMKKLVEARDAMREAIEALRDISSLEEREGDELGNARSIARKALARIQPEKS